MPAVRFDQFPGTLAEAEVMLDPETGRLSVETAEYHRRVFHSAGTRQGQNDRLEGLPRLLPVTSLEQGSERVVATGQRVRNAEAHRSHRQAPQCDHMELQVSRSPGEIAEAPVRVDRTPEIRR